MKLSDVMSHMALSSYAEAGLILFLLAFAAICLKLVLLSSKEEMAQAAALPLADDSKLPSQHPSAHSQSSTAS